MVSSAGTPAQLPFSCVEHPDRPGPPRTDSPSRAPRRPTAGPRTPQAPFPCGVRGPALTPPPRPGRPGHAHARPRFRAAPASRPRPSRVAPVSGPPATVSSAGTPRPAPPRRGATVAGRPPSRAAHRARAARPGMPLAQAGPGPVPVPADHAEHGDRAPRHPATLRRLGRPPPSWTPARRAAHAPRPSSATHPAWQSSPFPWPCVVGCARRRLPPRRRGPSFPPVRAAVARRGPAARGPRPGAGAPGRGRSAAGLVRLTRPAITVVAAHEPHNRPGSARPRLLRRSRRPPCAGSFNPARALTSSLRKAAS